MEWIHPNTKIKVRALSQAGHFAEDILVSFKISVILLNATLKMNLKQIGCLLPLLLIVICELKQVCNSNMPFLYRNYLFFSEI